jgi:hypothetical protein
MLSEATEEEYPMVIVDAPVEVTAPNPSSRSCDELSWKVTIEDHDPTPPPLTEVTLTVPVVIFTVRTMTSPNVTGATEREVTPLPCASANDPTAVMVGGVTPPV